MTQTDETIRFRHILDHAREAVGFIHGLEREDLESDRLLELALVRLLEIVGDAASRVPEEIRGQHPGVAWSKMIELPGRVIHGHDAVDLDILWKIVKDDLPSLITEMEKAIGLESSE